MEKWYSENKEIKEAKISGPAAAAFAVLMGGMGLWQAANKYNADPQEVQQIIEENKHNGVQWSEEQKAEWNTLQNETSPKNQQFPKQEKQEKQENASGLEKNILARTIYYEARGESSEGKKAVASVIYNRSNGTSSDMVKESLKPKQFSAWNNKSDKNKIVTYDKNPSWDECVKLAEEMVSGNFSPNHTYKYYWAPKGMKGGKDPYWAKNMKDRKTIGNHIFAK